MTPDPFFSSAGGLRPGSRFAGYVIERELGRGGAGVVFLARDEHLERLVVWDDDWSMEYPMDDQRHSKQHRGKLAMASACNHQIVLGGHGCNHIAHRTDQYTW